MISENSSSLMPLNMFDTKYVQQVWISSEFTSNGWLCLPFGEMHKLSERRVYTNNLFLSRSCKTLTKNAFLAKFKKYHSFKNLERKEKLLKVCCKIHSQIHLSCKICNFYKNFAKVVLIARILQEYCEICFSCELGYVYVTRWPATTTIFCPFPLW